MIQKVLLIATALLLLIQPRQVSAQAPAPDPIRAGYERLYQGEIDGAYEEFRALAQREPENLGAAFGVLMALYDRGLGDPKSQKEFEQRIDLLIQQATKRYEKTKEDTDALFYLEQAYLNRARYRADFGKGMWGAVRDGIKAKSYGDEYIKVDPGRADGYLAVGVYNYYVDIMPSFFKIFRVMLLMPGGNRTEGLKQIEKAANGGGMWQPFARDMLAYLYNEFENRTQDAVRLAENLQKQYPENPDYRFTLAGLYSRPEIEDYERAAQHYATIIQRVDQKHPNYKADQRYGALLNLARMRQQQWRYEEAISIIAPTIDSNISQPDWVMPGFLLARANYRMLMNDSGAAGDAQKVLADVKWKSRHANAQGLIRSIQERQQSGEAAVFAELIPGNRFVVEHRWDQARQEYERVRARRPEDWQVRYRLAYLEFARGEYSRAEAALNPIVNATSAKMPDWLKANAMLALARSYDVRGQRDRALQLYKKIIDTYEKQGAAGLARRGLVTPYHT